MRLKKNIQLETMDLSRPTQRVFSTQSIDKSRVARGLAGGMLVAMRLETGIYLIHSLPRRRRNCNSKRAFLPPRRSGFPPEFRPLT